MTAEDLMKCIRESFRFKSFRVLLIEELRIGAGFGGGAERRIDLWAIESNAASGCTATAFEIKVSKPDFKKDLEDPLKQRGARLFSDKFYYVAPEGIIRPGQVPDWAGLKVPSRHGGLQTVVEAPFRSKDAPSWPLVVSLLRRKMIMVGEDDELGLEGVSARQEDSRG